MAAVKLHKFCLYKLRRVFIACNQDFLSFAAYGFKNDVKDFINTITFKAFFVYEVLILDIVLDNFFIDFVCVFLFLSVFSGKGFSSLKGAGSGERIGMESVFNPSLFIASFFDRSVFCISLFNYIGLSDVGFSNTGLIDCS